MAIQDEVFEALSAWNASLPNLSQIEDTYVFGTLVYREGKGFGQGSDIDLIVSLNQTCSTGFDLFHCVKILQPEVEKLEGILMRMLKRTGNEAITSVVVLSNLEAYHSIHKGGDVKLLTGRRFKRLGNPAEFCAIAQSEDEPSFYRDNIDVISTLQFSQAIRNYYLANSYNT